MKFTTFNTLSTLLPIHAPTSQTLYLLMRPCQIHFHCYFFDSNPSLTSLEPRLCPCDASQNPFSEALATQAPVVDLLAPEYRLFKWFSYRFPGRPPGSVATLAYCTLSPALHVTQSYLYFSASFHPAPLCPCPSTTTAPTTGFKHVPFAVLFPGRPPGLLYITYGDFPTTNHALSGTSPGLHHFIYALHTFKGHFKTKVTTDSARAVFSFELKYHPHNTTYAPTLLGSSQELSGIPVFPLLDSSSVCRSIILFIRWGALLLFQVFSTPFLPFHCTGCTSTCFRPSACSSGFLYCCSFFSATAVAIVSATDQTPPFA